MNLADCDLEESHIFISFLSPISIYSDDKVAFINESQGDSRKCRPIFVSFRKESDDYMKFLYEKIDSVLNANRIIHLFL